MRNAYPWLLLCVLQACTIQGGAVSGIAIHEQSSDRATWGGQLVAAYEGVVHAGLELEGRAEHRRGSLFTSGVQLGYTGGNDNSGVRVGVHGDLGLGAGWSATPMWFIGATVELPIRLMRPMPGAERNRNFRVLGSAPWLVPFFRYRFYDLGGTGNDLHEASAGMALRMSYTTDLF